MVAALLAVLAALGFAGSIICSKKGLQHISVVGGVVISLPSGFLVAAALGAWDIPTSVSARGLLFFAIAGTFGAAIGRMFMIAGVQRLDTGEYIPLQTAAHPMTAVLGGIVLFNEQVGLVRGLGALAIVAGIWVIARSGPTPDLVPEAANGPGRWRTWGLGLAMLFPIGAGVAFGFADMATKEATTAWPHPVFGTAVAMLSACLIWGVMLGASKGLRRQIRIGSGKRWFVANGALSALAIMCSYAALERGDVSVVSPIISSQPFWVLLLSALFLRHLETVTLRAAVGAVFVVLGAVLVSVS